MRYVYVGDDRVYPSLVVSHPVRGEVYEMDQAPDDGRWHPVAENPKPEPLDKPEQANESTIDSNKEVG